MSDRECTAVENILVKHRIVPVVSVPSVDAGLRLAEILIRCDLPVMEVTFRTVFAADAIAAIKKKYNEILILAGTILTPQQANMAIDSGAECIVIPGFHEDLVTHCQNRKIMVYPGVMTPTEVLKCKSLGLCALKFFPAEIAGGVGMLKAMAAVFSDIRFMPTGGISPTNVLDYLRLNTVFCCGGSWLAPEDLMIKGDWTEVEKRISSAQSLLQLKA